MGRKHAEFFPGDYLALAAVDARKPERVSGIAGATSFASVLCALHACVQMRALRQ
jgi:hypothetical protein